MTRRLTRASGLFATAALSLTSLLALGTGTAQAAPVPCPIPADDPNLINLLGINDFHGRIDDNTVNWAATIEQLRAESGDANTALVGSGDSIGATLFASAVQDDKPTLDVLDALDMDASAVGNHEFDKGTDDLLNRVEPEADFPYLAANVYAAGTTDPILPEYALIEVNGFQVAFIGVVTEETPALTGNTGDLDFGDPVAAVNRVAGVLSDGDTANGEADVIVANFHEGAPEGGDAATIEEQVAANAVFANIVNNTSAQVDAIFNGHTHQEYVYDAPIPGQPGQTRPIVQTGSYGANIGQIMLSVDRATDTVTSYCAQNVPQLAEPTAEQLARPRVVEVAAIVEQAQQYAATVGNQPVGSVTADITTAFSGGGYTGAGSTYVGGKRDDRARVGAGQPRRELARRLALLAGCDDRRRQPRWPARGALLRR